MRKNRRYTTTNGRRCVYDMYSGRLVYAVVYQNMIYLSRTTVRLGLRHSRAVGDLMGGVEGRVPAGCLSKMLSFLLTVAAVPPQSAEKRDLWGGAAAPNPTTAYVLSVTIPRRAVTIRPA